MPGSACDGRVGIGVVGDPGMVFLVGPAGSRPDLDLRRLLVLRRLAAGVPCRPRQGKDREVPVTGAESELSVESLLDDHFGAGTKPLGFLLRDLPAPVRKANREVAGDDAIRGLGEDPVQIGVPGKGAVRVVPLRRLNREACVPERDPVRLEIAVRSVQRIDPGDAHLLHQPVLRRAEGALDPPLGLSRRLHPKRRKRVEPSG